jgi:hypothetical protein
MRESGLLYGRNRAIALLGIGLAVWLVAGATLEGQSGRSPDDSAGRQMGFSAADLLSAQSGDAVIKSLDTPVRQELAYVGMVYIDVSTANFIDRFRDIERFERGPGTPLIGRFSDPPQPEDLAELRLPPADIAALPTCRPGRCDVKLSANAMERFRNEVDWSSPTAGAQADEVARRMILDLVRAYQAGGNAALGYYDDGNDPLSVAEHLDALLASDDPLPAPIPALVDYLRTYPEGRPGGTEDFFYWTLVDFGLKPTIRVNHVTIYPLEHDLTSPVAYAIAIKQLYASHYFHTTLELRFLVEEDSPSGEPDTSLISITRSRSDGMTGFKGLFLRPIISRRSRDAVRAYLDYIEQQVERPVPPDP